MDLYTYFELFARAGGGGSSSSGDGGASGIFMIGFGLSYFFGRIIKKLLPRKPELIVSAVGASIATVAIAMIFIPMQGVGFIFAAEIIAGIWAGWAAAFFGAWEKLAKKRKAAKQAVQVAAQQDSAWDEQALLTHTQNTFLRYQQDWSNNDAKSMSAYTTQAYSYHASLLVYIMQSLGRRNILSNPVIKNLALIDIHDSANNNEDAFTVAIEAQMDDSLVETATNTTLFATKQSFLEYWTFTRQQDNWLLSDIVQHTASKQMAVESIKQFATANNFYYSADMGWLFLPKRGELMSGGKFGTSDINNHCVGVWGNLLVQLYTFIPSADGTTNNYAVAQLTLPKSYEGIILKPHASGLGGLFGTSKPKGYTQHKFEWEDFNKKYDVFSTRQDTLPTFELINPGFMQYMHDIDTTMSLEVMDNVVYIYFTLRSTATNNTIVQQKYNQLLTVLQKAHKELQL